MAEYDDLTREQLIERLRELERDRAVPHASAIAAGLPVFGERALREFGSSASPMRIFDLETFRYLAVNDAAVRFYGYSREEFLALTVKDTRHPEEHASFEETLAERADYLRYRPLRRQVKKSGEVVVVEAVTQDIAFKGRRARISLTIDVTGRLRMQELLWRRQHEFEALAENIPHLVARFDRDRRFVYVNSTVERVLGVPRHQLIGRTHRELGVSEALAEEFGASLEQALREGAPRRFDFSMSTAAHARQFEAYHIPERDVSGELTTVLCIAHDVTERAQSEGVLRETNEFLRSVIESSRNCINVLDLDGRLLLMNLGGQRQLEIDDVGPLLNTSWVDLWPAGQREKARSALAKAAAGSVCDFEGHAPTLKGTMKWWESTITPILGADGKAARLLVVSRDIGGRKKSLELQSTLAAIVNNSTDAIISKSLDGIIRTWNPGAERLFGYGADEAIGQPAIMLVPPERKHEEALILESVRAGRRIEDFESVRRRKDGARVHVSIAVSPITDAAGSVSGASSIVRDITERKEAELARHRSAALARLLESLARAANEALTPEAAMAACLERICRHGQWEVGRVEIFGASGPGEVPGRSIWYASDRDRFAEFFQFSNDRAHEGRTGPFIGRVLREQTAVWIDHIGQGPVFGRREAALRHRLHCAFAFPIIARGTVVAVMEVFGNEPRPQDPVTVGAAHSIASQLARIVEREWAHEADARMAAIVESSQDAVMSRRLDGTIITWNRAAERLLGYAADEIVGRNVRLIIPRELHPAMVERQNRLESGSPPPARETVRIAKDGRRVDVLTSPAPIRDSSGQICGVSTIIRDITEKKRAEQELRASEERFRQLAENIDQVFWINTPAIDRNLYVSPAYEKIWGRTREALRRDPGDWMKAVHADDRSRVTEALARIRGGEQLDVEYRIVRSDGQVRWIRDRSYPMTAGDGTTLVCGLAEDVTSQKQAEEGRLADAVRQRDALVREVHHRIKNSLQGVAGLLRQKVRKYPAIAPGIEEAIAQLQSVALVYGLQETRSDGLLSLAEITEAICASAESLIGGRVERVFERRSQRAACIAGSEAVSVAVALNELVFNALKHQAAQAGRKRARVALTEAAGGAEIRIANRGRLPKGFDFMEGREVGNGLGLVRTLLASPGGSVCFNGGRGEVEVILKLSAPLLAEGKGRRKMAVVK
jgi:PAS domain S-box-containing protein